MTKANWGLMARFWNKKTPAVSFITVGIVNVGLFIAASGGSRFGYWPPTILLVAILLAVVNNFRIDRAEREGH
jgi:CHASE2 domain-containing sensor protein